MQRHKSFQSLGWKKSLGVGSGNPFQYSCLENSMDRGAWQAPVAKSQTELKTEHKEKNIIMGESYCETVLLNFCPWVCEYVCVCVCESLCRVQFFVIPWTLACQACPSMGFSRQQCWSGLPFPSPRDLPDPGIEPGSPALQADSLLSEPPGKHMGGIMLNSVYKIFSTMASNHMRQVTTKH